MKILFPVEFMIPALKYGGTERVVWDLMKGLKELGHTVCVATTNTNIKPNEIFEVIRIDSVKNLQEHIPKDVDLVHFNYGYTAEVDVPVLSTYHGSIYDNEFIPDNSNFVSKNHANRHGWKTFVYNGLDFSDLPELNTDIKREGLTFLGNAAWRAKNVKGAIRFAQKAGKMLHVLGGKRFNFISGKRLQVRLTFDQSIKFHGMVDNKYKYKILNKSEALVSNVLCDEAFGLALIEAMACGCPVIGVPRGSLTELIGPEEGFLSEDPLEQINFLEKLKGIDRVRLSKKTKELYSYKKMTSSYVDLYKRILSGEKLGNSKDFHPCVRTPYKRVFQ